MNYYVYYLEIRNRIILLMVTWLFTAFICYLYKEVILFFILNSTNVCQLNPENQVVSNYFIFTDVTEIFYVYIDLILFLSNQIVLFSFFYHFLMFLSPGLYKFEYYNLYLLMKISFLIFIVSVILLNIFLMPLSWNFFLNFQDNNFTSIPFFFEAKVSEYLVYYINLYYLCLFNGQFSLLMLIYVSRFSTSIMKIKNLRKVFYFIFVVVSTLTTPPDVLSQLCLSFILIFIYEIIIFFKLLVR
uniref:Sec-independent protein translocase component TatC n=1 Tax=Nitzschia dissipata TaxID=303402 RepID=UPI0020291F29|nr:Sec-independent protein translocase component TatC [Nitzschia dissipata]QYB23054.1 Sec-independent protein translocase component TatC [Nitzschia dissipata]